MPREWSDLYHKRSKTIASLDFSDTHRFRRDDAANVHSQPTLDDPILAGHLWERLGPIAIYPPGRRGYLLRPSRWT